MESSAVLFQHDKVPNKVKCGIKAQERRNSKFSQMTDMDVVWSRFIRLIKRIKISHFIYFLFFTACAFVQVHKGRTIFN